MMMVCSGRKEEYGETPIPENYDPYVPQTVLLTVTEVGQLTTQT